MTDLLSTSESIRTRKSLRRNCKRVYTHVLRSRHACPHTCRCISDGDSHGITSATSHVSMHLSTRMPMHMFVRMSMHMPMHMFVRMSMHMPMHVSVHTSTHMPMHMQTPSLDTIGQHEPTVEWLCLCVCRHVHGYLHGHAYINLCGAAGCEREVRCLVSHEE